MQFSSSLKLNHIFRRLYRKGQSAANGYLVLYCRKNGSRQNRIGLTVSAKLAHAVHRNRLRRQLREIYRLHEAQFARGYDIVVVARTRAIGADYAALERAYLSLAAKLGLLGGQTACSGYACGSSACTRSISPRACRAGAGFRRPARSMPWRRSRSTAR